MLETKDILGKFKSLMEYEAFNLDWTRECARLNPTDRNTDRLKVQEHRAELLGLVV